MGFYNTIMWCLERISLWYSKQRSEVYALSHLSDRHPTPSYGRALDTARADLIKAPIAQKGVHFPNVIDLCNAEVRASGRETRETKLYENGDGDCSCSCGVPHATGKPCIHLLLHEAAAVDQAAKQFNRQFPQHTTVPRNRTMGAWRKQHSDPGCCNIGDTSQFRLDGGLKNPLYLPKRKDQEGKRVSRRSTKKSKVTCSACTAQNLPGAVGHRKGSKACPLRALEQLPTATAADVVEASSEEEEDLQTLNLLRPLVIPPPRQQPAVRVPVLPGGPPGH